MAHGEAFYVDIPMIRGIFANFGIPGDVLECSELLCAQDPHGDAFKLIYHVTIQGGASFVLKLVREPKHPRVLIEEQSVFSEHLRACGMLVPKRYAVGGRYCAAASVCGTEAVATVEDFADGEIKIISMENVGSIGAMLARAHNIAERDDCHVRGNTLFNALEKNELFSYECFEALAPRLRGGALLLVPQIRAEYAHRMRGMQGLSAYRRFATQGDLSICNLFQAPDQRIGMFDFNNCGDNYLFSDAILEGIFVSRLMDYEEPITGQMSGKLFQEFLRGYASQRSFCPEERAILPDLYAVVNAFWLGDLRYSEDCLANVLDARDEARSEQMLRSILRTLNERITVAI